MARKLTIFIPVLVVGLLLDQVTKWLVVKMVPWEKPIPIIPGFFDLVHSYNKGVAFGLLSSWLAEFPWLFFVAICLVLIVLAYLWWHLPDDYWPAALGYSLIITGALGNLIDRVRLGKVVDFLDVHWGHYYHWPAFNIADSLVCLGAGILVWVIFKEEKPIDASSPV